MTAKKEEEKKPVQPVEVKPVAPSVVKLELMPSDVPAFKKMLSISVSGFPPVEVVGLVQKLLNQLK